MARHALPALAPAARDRSRRLTHALEAPTIGRKFSCVNAYAHATSGCVTGAAHAEEAPWPAPSTRAIRTSAGANGSPSSTSTRDDTALVVIDMQYSCASADHGTHAKRRAMGFGEAVDYIAERTALIVPNIARLQAAFRERGMEVVFARICALTQDGRDRSKAHKDLGNHSPDGSLEATILEELKPRGRRAGLRQDRRQRLQLDHHPLRARQHGDPQPDLRRDDDRRLRRVLGPRRQGPGVRRRDGLATPPPPGPRRCRRTPSRWSTRSSGRSRTPTRCSRCSRPARVRRLRAAVPT